MKIKISSNNQLAEKIIYIITITLLVLTGISVINNRDDIKAYYEQKNHDKILAEEQTAFLNAAFEGKGTIREPYIIADGDGFEKIRECLEQGFSCQGVYFKQVTDIDLTTQRKWKAIGLSENLAPFCGVYDGMGHKITNLLLDRDNTSLFGRLGGTIKNLEVKNVYFGADECAVFSNETIEGTKPYIINCLVKNVDGDIYTVNNVIFSNEFSDGFLINCLSDGEFYFVDSTNGGKANLFNCSTSYFLYSLYSEKLEVNEENSKNLAKYNQLFVEKWNVSLADLNHYGLIGEFAELNLDKSNGLTLSQNTVQAINTEDLKNTYRYIRNLIIYLAIFLLDVAVCYIIYKKKKVNLTKAIIYSFLTICTLMAIGYAFWTGGISFMTLLYDVKENGRLKVFTDFFDCVRPGFSPYHGDNGISTIYPPFISLVFAIMGRMIPRETLYSSIAAKDSQMGSVIFAFCIVAVIIFLYEVICNYKQGKKSEQYYFFGLLMFTYPMVHCIERGNIAAILCSICITLFLFNYRETEYKKRRLSWIALSIAAGIKIYPAILGLLLIKERKYKDTVNCLAYGITINLLPSVFFDTGLSSVVYMVINAKTMVSNNSVIGGKINLSQLVKMFGRIFHIAEFEQYYGIILALFIILSILVICFGKISMWKVYALLILDIVVLSSFAPFYYLLYMMAPLMMFLDSKENKKWESIVYGGLFIGIFMIFTSTHKYPLAYFVPEESIWSTTPVAGVSALLFIMILIGDGLVSIIKKYRRQR